MTGLIEKHRERIHVAICVLQPQSQLEGRHSVPHDGVCFVSLKTLKR
jgi:hypothetical protein